MATEIWVNISVRKFYLQLVHCNVLLAQVMAYYLMSPSHYLNQCLLCIREVLWHPPENHYAYMSCWSRSISVQMIIVISLKRKPASCTINKTTEPFRSKFDVLIHGQILIFSFMHILWNTVFDILCKICESESTYQAIRYVLTVPQHNTP